MTEGIKVIDSANAIYATSAKKDKQIQDLFRQIDENTLILEDNDRSYSAKYDAVLSVEFLFFRARVLVEFEHISVKNILNNPDTPPSLRPFFTKRDVYLSQLCLKLTTIREDLTTLQKLVYTKQNYTIK